jgi:hypothetical protein
MTASTSGHSSPFNSFEIPILATLGQHLSDPSKGPLLTNNEDDLVIIDSAKYIDHAAQLGVPGDALERLRTGNLTREALRSKMKASQAIIMRKKGEMFADRLMTATFAADTCQALYRVATGGELVPVLPDDTVETITHRVGDYVTDLLDASRQTRLVRNAAADRLTGTIRDKFETSPDAARKLTMLAGKNSMKKVVLYADQLQEATNGFAKGRISATTRKDLMTYAIGRPKEFHENPDLIMLITDRAKR